MCVATGAECSYPSGHPDDCWLHAHIGEQKKMHRRLHDTIAIAEQAVAHAKDHGAKVRQTFGHTPRTGWCDLASAWGERS